MKYNVVLAEQAELDIRNIYEYIALTLLKPSIAVNQYKRIEKAILGLEEMPYRFKRYDKEPWHSIGLHQMPVDNFKVFYIPLTENKSVTIIRVMYGGQDIYNTI